MPQPQQCLDDSELQALIDGSVPEEKQGPIAAHLERCEHCRRRLDALANDGGAIPTDVASGVESAGRSEALQEAMQNLKADANEPAETSIMSDGTLATAYLSEQDGKLVIERSGVMADGTRFTTRPEGVFTADRIDFKQSEWVTDGGKVIQTIKPGFFQRIEEPKPPKR